MCIVSRVAAMFRSMSSYCSCGGDNPAGRPDDDDQDQDLPMLAPPPTLGLSRQETMRVVRATPLSASFATASDEDSGSSFPTVSQRLKPRPFRRKDPPLHVQASVRGDRQELDKWLVSGGDANIRDDDRWALLHHASMHGRDECVELLLRRGAKHDQLAIGGHTVLHLATANRHCQVVKRLVEAGALVDARNAHGNTALHSAAATGTIDVLSYLLSQSADPGAVNSLGEMPDQVSGATSEAVHLVREARRLKQARIAQRFALVKIHKLWNSGRAEPVSGCRRYAPLPVASPAEMQVSTSDILDGKALTETVPRRPEAQRPCAAVAPSTATAAAAAAATAEASVVQGVADSRRVERGGDCEFEHEDEAEAEKEDRQIASLGSTVSVIAALPQEVLRRVVGYCSL